MIRVGKPMAHNTYAIYVGATLTEVVYANSQRQAYYWAVKTYGSTAYAMENVQARDIT
jgi:hypothetical protein